MPSLDELLPSDLVTVRSAARFANNTSLNAVRRWIFKGKLKGYRFPNIGTQILLVSKSDVLNLIHPDRHHEPRFPPMKRAKWVAKIMRESSLRR